MAREIFGGNVLGECLIRRAAPAPASNGNIQRASLGRRVVRSAKRVRTMESSAAWRPGCSDALDVTPTDVTTH